ncbi:PIN domain-containing protein [Haloferula sp. A504]|uniref:PIN domain-containing protein n=1 Tax=Haloferula sp. A504 TaxID=3373601 RepID=UPI0031CA50A2|nr:PIN domain-containing protein [Verrucomicrobiaceae bacterium E54]
MTYLLDVNVLVAWGWADHADHYRAARWIGEMIHRADTTLLTSAIPELGFIRVSLQRAGGRLSPSEATRVLHGLIRTLGTSHRFLADDLSSTLGLPEWCLGASRSTDAHLVALANDHNARLATLDTGIPGAYLIPQAS